MIRLIEQDRRNAAARDKMKCKLFHDLLKQQLSTLETMENTLTRARAVNSNASSAAKLSSSGSALVSAEENVDICKKFVTLSQQAYAGLCENAGETPYTQHHQPVNLHNSAGKREVIEGAKGPTAGVDSNRSSMSERQCGKKS